MSRPDFVGIGAQKAATTWLFKRLCMHPDIYFPRGKEIHFWDRRDQMGRKIVQYQRMFSGKQIDHIGGKTGEITPAYLRITDARIAELKELAPDLRLMVILRNPVERAISAAAQAIRNNEGSQNPLFSRNTTEGGLYGKHLGRWLAHFSKDQLLVLTQDEIKVDGRAVLKKVATHVGVEPGVYDLIDRSLLDTTTSPTPNRLDVLPDDMKRLKSIFREDIQTLEALLGRSFDWDI
ncbi:sulfotransferase domain-containing protein [Shimia haliotis]|uniref:Sulfotransferase domain-containing protein n=1 Tax=Shimia haliotis TaxID=1280847 RepID=A0A1I4EG23_9RHOB|nr:sulfotransferase domain-containing protein [Shimia haliotis]SFL04714.1 Sulfotransferase domain-containing protein [Shimia haliotis]